MNNGIERMGTGELDGELKETLTAELVVSFVAQLLTDTHSRERREHRVFQDLLLVVPALEERLTKGSNEDIVHIADLVCAVPCCYIAG